MKFIFLASYGVLLVCNKLLLPFFFLLGAIVLFTPCLPLSCWMKVGIRDYRLKPLLVVGNFLLVAAKGLAIYSTKREACNLLLPHARSPQWSFLQWTCTLVSPASTAAQVYKSIKHGKSKTTRGASSTCKATAVKVSLICTKMSHSFSYKS